MSKAPKLKKGKHQKELRELWKHSMNSEASTTSNPKSSTEDCQEIKKRTPPSTEKPKTKRAIRSNIPPKSTSKEEVEMEEPIEPLKQNMHEAQNGKEPEKVNLSPELLELYKMLHHDLDTKIDPLQQSVNDIKTKLSTQENKIEEVMKIKHENSKLQTRCSAI